MRRAAKVSLSFALIVVILALVVSLSVQNQQLSRRDSEHPKGEHTELSPSSSNSWEQARSSRTKHLHGVVLSRSDGGPAADADLACRTELGSFHAKTTTDGTFELSFESDRDVVELRVDAEHHHSGQVDVVDNWSGKIELDPIYEIRIRAKEPRIHPENVDATILAGDGSVYRAVRADPSTGNLAVGVDVPRGECVVRVHADGFCGTWSGVPEAAAREFVRQVAVILRPCTTVAGVVRHSDGDPVESGMIRFEEQRSAEASGTTKIANSRFEAQVRPGTRYPHVLEKDATAWLGTQEPLIVEETSEVQEVELLLVDTMRVSGRVVDARTGSGVVKAFLVASSDGVTAHGIVETDENGLFSLEIPRVSVFLNAQSDGYSTETVGPIDEPVEDLLITLKPRGTGQLELRVVDALTGAPLTRFDYKLDGINRVHFSSRSTHQSGWKRHGDNEGVARIDELEPGVYGLSVRAEDHVGVDGRSVSIVAGETTRAVVEAAKGNHVTGRITTEDGEPVDEADVRLFREFAYLDSTNRLLDATKSRADGSFAFPYPVETGAFSVEALRAGIGRSIVQFDVVGDVHLHISMNTATRVHGRLLDSDGEPLAGAAVECSQQMGPTFEATTDRDGGFRFDGLGAGLTTLHASGAGVMRFVKMELGEEKYVELVVSRGLEVTVELREEGRRVQLNGYGTLVRLPDGLIHSVDIRSGVFDVHLGPGRYFCSIHLYRPGTSPIDFPGWLEVPEVEGPWNAVFPIGNARVEVSVSGDTDPGALVRVALLRSRGVDFLEFLGRPPFWTQTPLSADGSVLGRLIEGRYETAILTGVDCKIQEVELTGGLQKVSFVLD